MQEVICVREKSKSAYKLSRRETGVGTTEEETWVLFQFSLIGARITVGGRTEHKVLERLQTCREKKGCSGGVLFCVCSS